MPKTNYNPFNKELNDLTEADLDLLISNKVAEGWFIEYKSRIPVEKEELDRLKIAKSISALANTKGGWIFWGVECTGNFPTLISGVDISTSRNFHDSLSQLIASNIDPKPIYHFKEVSLVNGLVVFIILVEESPLPPYLTSQGVIYQRENSECKPIRDRYILEKLNERAADYISSIESFSEFNLGETKGQSESSQSFLELYLFPKPFNSFQFRGFYESDFFRTVAAKFYQSVDFKFSTLDDMIPMNLSFDSIYNSGHSLIARVLKGKNLIRKGTTAELFKNGNLKCCIPLTTFNGKTIPEHYEHSPVTQYLLNKFSPFETVDEFLPLPGFRGMESSQVTRRSDSDFMSFVDFIDGFDVIMVVTIIIEKYRSILKDSGFDMTTDVGLRIRVTNTFRKFLFFDSADYLEKIKLFNIPVNPKNDIEMPEFGKGKSYTITLDENSITGVVARLVLDSIGLPDSSTIDLSEILKTGIKRFSHANEGKSN